MENQTFSALINQEDDMFVAQCPEIGTVSQGKTIEEALINLKEATELYLEEFPIKQIKMPVMTFFNIQNGRIKKNIRQ